MVLSNAFEKPAIAVDTHVARVSNRLGLADSNDVLKIEKQLMENIPEDKWSIAHHWLIFHGRRVCSSKKPNAANARLKVFAGTMRKERRCGRKRPASRAPCKDAVCR